MAPPGTVMDAEHPGAVLRRLDEQRGRGTFCDVTIIVGDHKFRAHRNVLAASSPYFSELLFARGAESGGAGANRVLEISFVRAEVFAEILNFIYSSKLSTERGAGGGDDAALSELVSSGEKLGMRFLAGLEKSPGSPERRETPVPAPPAAETPRAPRPAPAVKKELSEKEALEASDGPRILSSYSIPQMEKAAAAAKAAVREARRENCPAPAAAPVPAPPATPSSCSLRPSLEPDHYARVVEGQVLYFCSVCDRSYVQLTSLKRHSNVHSWTKQYPCRYCERVFALAEYRTKHEIWHTGERRYQCIFCSEAFLTYHFLKTHQRTQHGVNPCKTADGGGPAAVAQDPLVRFYRLLPRQSLRPPHESWQRRHGYNPIPRVSSSSLSPSEESGRSSPCVLRDGLESPASAVTSRLLQGACMGGAPPWDRWLWKWPQLRSRHGLASSCTVVGHGMLLNATVMMKGTVTSKEGDGENTPRAERRRSVGCGRCGVGGGGVGGGDEDAGSGTVSKKRPWGRHGQPRVSPRP
ncbi:unnamed protein product [Lampetra planeri]